MCENILILGGGIAGLSADYTLRQQGLKATIYEKNDTYGGLCNSFEVNGYIFDTFAHLTFSKNDYVKTMLEEKTEYITHIPEAYNYYQTKWLKNPVQNNLYHLDLEEKIEVIKSFINRKQLPISNYEDWLRNQYGDYFTNHFPSKYTRKYWTLEPRELEYKWVEGRMYKPEIEEVLRGAMTEHTPNVHYSKEMHYPKYGGYKSFLKPFAENSDIKLNKEVIKINSRMKTINFSDGEKIHYDKLISTIPLTELSSIINDLPEKISHAIEELDYTSGVIISLGFNKKIKMPSMWFYIYDENIYPARVYSPSIKSPNNVPDGCSSIQAEVYFSNKKPLPDTIEYITEQTINQLEQMGLFIKNDIVLTDVRVMKYANIIFTPNIYKARNTIHDYLRKEGIICAGRFGEWDYLWTDQSILSGKKAAEKILEIGEK